MQDHRLAPRGKKDRLCLAREGAKHPQRTTLNHKKTGTRATSPSQHKAMRSKLREAEIMCTKQKTKKKRNVSRKTPTNKPPFGERPSDDVHISHKQCKRKEGVHKKPIAARRMEMTCFPVNRKKRNQTAPAQKGKVLVQRKGQLVNHEETPLWEKEEGGIKGKKRHGGFSIKKRSDIVKRLKGQLPIPESQIKVLIKGKKGKYSHREGTLKKKREKTKIYPQKNIVNGLKGRRDGDRHFVFVRGVGRCNWGEGSKVG